MLTGQVHMGTATRKLSEAADKLHVHGTRAAEWTGCGSITADIRAIINMGEASSREL
jgi:hypothetical protein